MYPFSDLLPGLVPILVLIQRDVRQKERRKREQVRLSCSALTVARPDTVVVQGMDSCVRTVRMWPDFFFFSFAKNWTDQNFRAEYSMSFRNLQSPFHTMVFARRIHWLNLRSQVAADVLPVGASSRHLPWTRCLSLPPVQMMTP